MACIYFTLFFSAVYNQEWVIMAYVWYLSIRGYSTTMLTEFCHSLVNDVSNLASFYGSHIDEIVCVKQIGLGSAMTLKKY